MSDNIYSWKFDDTKERWILWYIIALSIALWLCLWWFLTKQYIMSFIVLLISGIMYYVEVNSDEIVEVKISNIWVKIAWKFYDYKVINSIWIVYDNEKAIFLRFFFNKKWIKVLDVKINDEIVNDIKNALFYHIDSEDMEKIEITFIEKIIHLLKL